MAPGMKKGDILRGPPCMRLVCLEQVTVLALDDIESADAAADVHPDSRRILARDLEAGRSHGFIRRRDGEVDEAPHLLDFFFLDELQRVEVADFAGDLGRELRGVELLDLLDAALAGQ